MSKGRTIWSCLGELSGVIRPPDRLRLSEFAEKYRYLYSDSYKGEWRNSETPYLVEVMDSITSRENTATVFVTGAQTGKTEALLNAMLCFTTMDPSDTLFFGPTERFVNEFSEQKVDRLFRNCEISKDKIIKDNVFKKTFMSGSILTLSYPTPSSLSSKTIGKILITERDRMSDDIGGEGEIFDLAMKRATTFLSRAMVYMESSPSRNTVEKNWLKQSEHEAPPVGGIFSVYNRGDRRRYYLPCPHCGMFSHPEFKLMDWPKDEGMSNTERGEQAWLTCSICGGMIEHKHKMPALLDGIWVPDGFKINHDNGTLIGTKKRNDIASFWLSGLCARFLPWPTLVKNYLDAMDEYNRTLSEASLVKFYNTDLGDVYRSKSHEDDRTAESLMTIADATLKQKIVPDNVRFLLGTADVQKDRFVCQVFGVSPGTPHDMVLIDRFEIRKSLRKDEDGDTMPLMPASYLDDWELLIDKLICAKYHREDGRVMTTKITGCDSGGQDGVTSNAYNFWRSLKRRGMGHLFRLVKGTGNANARMTEITYPDAQHKDKLNAARGDVPVLLINSNAVKDILNGRLDCMTPGNGMIRLPSWPEKNFFDEMTIETRTDKGWECPKGARNEAWDLACYAIALCMSSLMRVDYIDWNNPPSWASLDNNHNIMEDDIIDEHDQDSPDDESDPEIEIAPKEPVSSKKVERDWIAEFEKMGASL